MKENGISIFVYFSFTAHSWVLTPVRVCAQQIQHTFSRICSCPGFAAVNHHDMARKAKTTRLSDFQLCSLLPPHPRWKIVTPCLRGGTKAVSHARPERAYSSTSKAKESRLRTPPRPDGLQPQHRSRCYVSHRGHMWPIFWVNSSFYSVVRCKSRQKHAARHCARHNLVTLASILTAALLNVQLGALHEQQQPRTATWGSCSRTNTAQTDQSESQQTPPRVWVSFPLRTLVPAALQILRSFLRGQTLRGFNPQKNPAKDLASTVLHLHWRNPAKMVKGQEFCSRRFGHRSVRSQMPQTCASRALWPPTDRWPNLLSVPQSLFFSFFHNLQCCGVLCGFLRNSLPHSSAPSFSLSFSLSISRSLPFSGHPPGCLSPCVRVLSLSLYPSRGASLSRSIWFCLSLGLVLSVFSPLLSTTSPSFSTSATWPTTRHTALYHDT